MLLSLCLVGLVGALLASDPVSAGGASFGPSVTIFGAGKPGFSICEAPTTVLSYNLSASASFGIASHFWTTGGVDTILVEYYVDGEPTPSIAFEPALACGQGFPTEDGSDPISTGELYSAGGKMGKGAAVGAW